MKGKIGWKKASRTPSGSLAGGVGAEVEACDDGEASPVAVAGKVTEGFETAVKMARSAPRASSARAAGETPASIDLMRFSKGSTPLITRPILHGRVLKRRIR
jgi:hypothetical protein